MLAYFLLFLHIYLFILCCVQGELFLFRLRVKSVVTRVTGSTMVSTVVMDAVVSLNVASEKILPTPA